MGHIKDMVPSSSGLGRGPLKAKTRVQISLGPPITKKAHLMVSFLLFRCPRERKVQRHTWVAHPTGCANPEYP